MIAYSSRFGIIAVETARVPNLLQQCGISKAIGTIDNLVPVFGTPWRFVPLAEGV